MHQKAPLNIYEQLFGEEPSSDETITCGTALVTAISEADEKKWMETLEKEPSSDETITCGTALVTAISEADEKKWMETLEMMIMFVVPK
ncbi:hypothetical protein QE152_g33188 [Popillia japonica]|uniref:Uncharacterized protein n=1 Tax=Popillia japonica TaxID=7064 RepID=A0AAW1IXK3_POPJA